MYNTERLFLKAVSPISTGRCLAGQLWASCRASSNKMTLQRILHFATSKLQTAWICSTSVIPAQPIPFPVLTHPQLTSQFEIHAWMTEFEANKKQDHAQLIKALSQVQEHQVIIEETTSSTNDLVQQMMVMLQKVLVHFLTFA